jgi:hypothetical protein
MGRYEIVAGHLRYEACKRLGWKTIPALVRNRQVTPDIPKPRAVGEEPPPA